MAATSHPSVAEEASRHGNPRTQCNRALAPSTFFRRTSLTPLPKASPQQRFQGSMRIRPPNTQIRGGSKIIYRCGRRRNPSSTTTPPTYFPFGASLRPLSPTVDVSPDMWLATIYTRVHNASLYVTDMPTSPGGQTCPLDSPRLITRLTPHRGGRAEVSVQALADDGSASVN